MVNTLTQSITINAYIFRRRHWETLDVPHSTLYASEENNPLSTIPFCIPELNSYIAMTALVTQCCANKVTKAELDG